MTPQRTRSSQQRGQVESSFSLQAANWHNSYMKIKVTNVSESTISTQVSQDSVTMSVMATGSTTTQMTGSVSGSIAGSNSVDVTSSVSETSTDSVSGASTGSGSGTSTGSGSETSTGSGSGVSTGSGSGTSTSSVSETATSQYGQTSSTYTSNPGMFDNSCRGGIKAGWGVLYMPFPHIITHILYCILC